MFSLRNGCPILEGGIFQRSPGCRESRVRWREGFFKDRQVAANPEYVGGRDFSKIARLPNTGGRDFSKIARLP